MGVHGTGDMQYTASLRGFEQTLRQLAFDTDWNDDLSRCERVRASNGEQETVLVYNSRYFPMQKCKPGQ
jgi:hypothetical protein